jgi:hypothetical protein
MIIANSASFNCRSEDVRVLPVIIAELEFSDVERHIFAAHFVECADHAAFKDRPEAFDRLSMDCADDILTTRMVNDAMGIFPVKSPIASILVGTEQADFVRDGFANECGESGGLYVRDYTRNHIALACDSADDGSFAGTNAACTAAASTLIPMPVFGQTADESFIDFDNSAEFSNVLHQGHADLVTHGPSRLIRTEAHIALDLQGAHALFAGQHEVDDAIPVTEWLVCVLEYCSGNVRKAIAGIGGALIALPAPWAIRQFMRVLCAAARASNPIWPTATNEICATGIFVLEHPFELRDRKLMDWFGLLACHKAFPSDHRRIMA